MPQGSILEPILFLIFINDLKTALKLAKCLLYADDAKFCKTVNDIHNNFKLHFDFNLIELLC